MERPPGQASIHRALSSNRTRGLRARATFLGALLVLAATLGAVLDASSNGPSLSSDSHAVSAWGSTPAVVPPPLPGVVTKCGSASSCDFTFNTSAGTGSAIASPPTITFQLPGEAVASHNVSYTTFTKRLTGTYTYWTVGSFEGTDASTRKVVYGVTNTNFTITCVGHSGRGGGCTYTYKTDNGTIQVNFTQADQTVTSASCSPSSTVTGGSTVCTARVNDTVNGSASPSGNVSFSTAYGATSVFSTGGACTLVSGVCSVSYSAPDDQLGTVPISASYRGTPAYYQSAGGTSVYVSSSDTGGGSAFSAVHFSESGLPSGSLWSVTFGGLLLSSTNVSMSFEVQNGTYAFSVGAIPGYLIAPRGGNVTVTGAGRHVDITYALPTYLVSFAANGLPVGKPWSVGLDGSFVTGTAPSVGFNVTNGTHVYLVRGPAGFRVTGLPPTGTLSVNGSAVADAVGFVRGSTYSISFQEAGLPPGTTWCIAFAGLVCTTGHALRFANLTPAVYPYAVSPIPGEVISAKLLASPIGLNGTLNLTTRGLSVHLKYVYPYQVTFSEVGLPIGTNWSVTVRGASVRSANNSTSVEVPNGTFSYRVGTVAGYASSGAPLRIVVRGGAVSVLITFRPVA